MTKISQMSRLRSVYKTLKGLKKDIKTKQESMESQGMKKSEALIRLDKSVNKFMKGFHSISRSSKGRTYKRSKKHKKKHKKSKKISSHDVKDKKCKKGPNRSEIGIIHSCIPCGFFPTKRRSGLPPVPPDILKEKIVVAYGLTSKVSEIFCNLIKSVVLERKCLDEGENRELIYCEKMIHKTACEYTATGILPRDWKYDPTIARTIARTIED